MTQALRAHNPYPGDSFGSNISLNDDLLIVGSTEPAATGTVGGEAEVFQRDAVGQFQSTQVILPAPEGVPLHFGCESLSYGEMVLIGDFAHLYSGASCGSVEFFQRSLGSQICPSATMPASQLDVFANDGVDINVPAIRLTDDAGAGAIRFLVIGRAPSLPGAGGGVPLCVAGGALLRLLPNEVTPQAGSEVEAWFQFEEPWLTPFFGQRLYLQGVTLGGTGGPVLSPGIEYGG